MTTSMPHAVSEVAPTGDELTDYDRAHVTTYLRLLDAASAGAEWSEVARIVLGFDAEQDAGRSRRAVISRGHAG